MRITLPQSSSTNHFAEILDAPFEEGSPEFLSKFKDCEVVAGSELKLECKFAGSPQPEVEWFKDGGPLVKNNRITCTVSDDSTSLVIKKTEADDEGWYRCRISNERGVAAVEAELIVVEAPTFVTGLEDITIDEGIKWSNLLIHSQESHSIAASCRFYRLAASCQQVAASLMNSSSCSKSVKIRLVPT